MEDVRIPSPNPALGAILKSSEMRSLVQEKAEMAQALYRDLVRKRTGQLARSARVSTYIGGARNDRWIAEMIVDAPHAAAHEFGVGDKPGSLPKTAVHAAADDLNQVLGQMSFAGQL
jgi:hypothetical protein